MTPYLHVRIIKFLLRYPPGRAVYTKNGDIAYSSLTSITGEMAPSLGRPGLLTRAVIRSIAATDPRRAMDRTVAADPQLRIRAVWLVKPPRASL